MATTDRKFAATAESTSKHPHDWGRAMAVAICRLTEMAREAGDPVHHEALVGEDLHLFVEDTEEGVNITMSWTPREQGSLAAAPSHSTGETGETGRAAGGSDEDEQDASDAAAHSAAGQRFDPTGGSTAGVGQ
ncbi:MULTISPECIES: hypothetical protein [unclassified Arthrobacter]|uniref:hypothetical protein n=1 Tax=Arthrobacter sp. Leaf234 TaxID=1736303 RepID=UPI0006F2F198|nr:hypothetical protein [Arthrobacter sp. Leaf234]KQO03447.1 hypothetical protein ASF21_03960 [Arthrobacter sp. Leaf234]